MKLGARGVVLWGRCDRTWGAPAYWPWSDLVRSHLTALPRAAAAAALAEASPLVRSLVPWPQPGEAELSERQTHGSRARSPGLALRGGPP